MNQETKELIENDKIYYIDHGEMIAFKDGLQRIVNAVIVNEKQKIAVYQLIKEEIEKHFNKTFI